MHGLTIDCTGKRYGQVTAIKAVGQSGRSVLWLCRCDCGAEITRTRKTFKDNERKGYVTRCSRNCPAKKELGCLD